MYEEHFPYQQLKCDTEFAVASNGVPQTELSCRNMCNILKDCKFYFYTLEQECQMFRSCDYSQKTKHFGITYRKKGK